MITDIINFRTKFRNLLESCSEKLCQKLKEITLLFVNNESNDECLDLLWLMTYDSNQALSYFGLTLEDDLSDNQEFENIFDNEEFIKISSKLAKSLKNELRHQRTLIHKDFLSEDGIPQSCLPTYTDLLSKTDPVIAAIAYKVCKKFCKHATKGKFNRSRYLLSSNHEANYFGGIRSLHLTQAQAMVFKNYSVELHNLLECLWEEKLASMPSLDESVVLETPSRVYKIDINNDSYESQKVLTPVNIKEDEETFLKFILACDELKKIGYDYVRIAQRLDDIKVIFTP